MSKKYLRKNEFRLDNNPLHFGKENKLHFAYIKGRQRHIFKANDMTHARKVNGMSTYDILENFNKHGDIWTDGSEIYYSCDKNQFVLNKETSTWEEKERIGPPNNELEVMGKIFVKE